MGGGAGVLSALSNVDAHGCETEKLVVPGQPGESYLLRKMVGGELCAGSLMPLGDSRLPDADLEKMAAWICAGALDN